MFGPNLPQKLFLNLIFDKGWKTSKKLMGGNCKKFQVRLNFQPSRMYESEDILYSDETCEECVDAYHVPQLKKNLQRLKIKDTMKERNPCWQSLRRSEYKCRSYQQKFIESFVDESAECIPPCSMAAPRTDLTYYQPSDKLNRTYQRTWVECNLQQRPVKTRCVIKPVYPERRPRNASFKGACGQPLCTLGSPNLKLVPCKPFRCKKCPRMLMPCCKQAIVPGKCRVGKYPSQCRRRLTKYPSYSECLTEKIPAKLPIECGCLKTPSMCSVREYYRHLRS